MGSKVIEESRIEDAWVEVLAHIYNAVDWKRIIRGKRSPYDVFEHRLEFARYEPTIGQVLQKLLNTLNLQLPKLPLNQIELLRENEELALKVLRKIPKLLSLKAIEKAKELKRVKKEVK